ncbi:MAG TPA: toll/interleukin-1 receptor domain-containing protein [Pyrinomonadaceae bacterium]|nr:toll/interleukin-1 receptor domain-containing protein [Pyrinomonadaceae bacterium]
MANEEHVALVKQGSSAWNEWRRINPDIIPDLSEADLSQADLRWVNLIGGDLYFANLSVADLRWANLSGGDLRWASLNGADLRLADLSVADLSVADLSRANLGRADLGRANLSLADLRWTNLSWANLSEANLHRANINEANLRQANLSGANLSEAELSGTWLFSTIFADNDLSATKGLETVTHFGPSTLGVDTLFKSNGKIPEVFLRGVGVPDNFITLVSSIISGTRPGPFHSCFISYSHRDEQFLQRLHARMRDEQLQVWYAPEDMKSGRKLHEEIFSAIQTHDKLLLVLSESSMKSEWVITEIRRARKVEREENRRKLFPIRLVDFEAIQKWECFDADSSKDLAVELREYYIPDFSNWKNHDAFEAEFSKLLRDLRATGT